MPRSKSQGTRRLRAEPPSRGTVLVVGSINVDLVARARRLPAPGETVSGGTFERHHGGKGANQAVAAARLGAAVTFVGAVGDDEFGREALAELQREGIAVGRVKTLSGAHTGVALITVDERGENQVTVAPGANAALDAQLVEQALSDLDDLGPDAMLLVNLEISDEAVQAAASWAASRRIRVVLNPAPARQLPGALLAARPIVVANLGEAETLTHQRAPADAARALVAQTGAASIITLGERGAIVVEPQQDVALLPAPRVEVVDTTGAGDTFCGTLSAELAAGTSLLEAARVGVSAASMSVTARGARGGMPRKEDLDRV